MLTVPFDLLPDAGRVRVEVAAAVTGLSRSALYAAAAKKRFPPIEKIGNSRSSVIRVREIRRYLDDPDGYRALD